MTVAVSRAKGAGAEAVICASTGNTAASAAAYAARAGMRGAVIVPEGKIAVGKLAQALIHGARVIALRGNFDDALRIVRELADRSTRSSSSTRSTPTGSRARRRRRSRSATSSARPPTRSASRSATPATSPPGGPAFGEYDAAPSALRLPGRGRRAPRPRPSDRQAGDDRLRDPDRQPGALGGGDGRGHGVARPDRGGLRRADPRRLPLPRRPRGRLLRAGLGRLGRRASSPTAPPVAEGDPTGGTIVCVLTGHGLKDPDTALGKAPSVLRRRDRPRRGREARLRLSSVGDR